jgi:hypothetical protein
LIVDEKVVPILWRLSPVQAIRKAWISICIYLPSEYVNSASDVRRIIESRLRICDRVEAALSCLKLWDSSGVAEVLPATMEQRRTSQNPNRDMMTMKSL